MKDFITDELLLELGFKKVKAVGEPQYGKAIDIKTNGMTVLTWNTEGHSCTYFGEKLEANISLGIGKDGGTRTTFNGYVFNEDDLRKVLKLTW